MTGARLKYLIFTALLAHALPASAGKFDAYAGGYSFSAKTRSSSGTKSGFGAYKIAYQIPLSHNIEAGIGYTLILSNTFGGDAAFGFDIDASYFPLSDVGAVKLQTEKTRIKYETLWRPLISIGYHARQFQSVSTQYNGFSAAVGVERVLDAGFNAKAILRYGKFAGANNGEATEITSLLGLTFSF